VNGNKLLLMIQRSRPAKATETYLKQMLGFRDHAQQVLDTGFTQVLPRGEVKSRAESYGVTETPLTPEDRQDWEAVRDAAQAEADWARTQLPRTRIKGR